MPAGLFTTAMSESSKTISEWDLLCMARIGGNTTAPNIEMRSFPCRRSEALASASSTNTLPSEISCCTRARLVSVNLCGKELVEPIAGVVGGCG